MYKFIQKNQKKFLAIFGVGLMIVFIVPSTMRRNTGHAETIFHAGGEGVTMGELRQAQEQWRDIATFLPMEANAFQQIAGDLDKNPELFLLLQKEAHGMGLRVSEAQVDEGLTRLREQYAMYRRPLPGPAVIRPVVGNLLLVRALFERVADGIKPSGPMVVHEMAENGQRVKLDLTHYSTEDFKKGVAAPTAEQLQKQFDAYKNAAPEDPTEQNPFGFGYLEPAQVKLLYVTVPRAEVTRAVRAGKSEFDWDVAAITHYKKNLSKYPLTQPSSKPSTTQAAATQTAASQPGSRPATAAASATRPTTQPFADVRDDIVKELLKPIVDARIDKIAGAVHDKMAADFDARVAKKPGAPDDFGTRQYLERVAADVAKREEYGGVKLGVSEINEPKSLKTLTELKGIGRSFAGEMSFPQYVMRWAEPLLPLAQRTAPEVLSLDEPSRTLRDIEGSVYVFQLREATPAHPPAALDAVKARVEADVRTKMAFEAAVDAAKKLRTAAAASRLAPAAKAAGKDVFTTPDFFDRRGINSAFEPVKMLPGVELPEASRQILVKRSFELLGQGSPDKPHPSAVVELPAAGRVVVAELADLQRQWKDDQQPFLEQRFTQQIMAERAQRLLTSYFNTDAVKKRLEYRSVNEAPTQTAAAR